MEIRVGLSDALPYLVLPVRRAQVISVRYFLAYVIFIVIFLESIKVLGHIVIWRGSDGDMADGNGNV